MLREQSLLMSPCNETCTVCRQSHVRGGKLVNHFDRVGFLELTAANGIGNEPQRAVDLNMIATSRPCTRPLVDDYGSSVHTRPRECCGLTIIPFQATAEFRLVPCEGNDLLNLSQLDDIHPWQANRRSNGRILCSAADYFCHYLSGRDASEAG